MPIHVLGLLQPVPTAPNPRLLTKQPIHPADLDHAVTKTTTSPPAHRLPARPVQPPANKTHQQTPAEQTHSRLLQTGQLIGADTHQPWLYCSPTLMHCWDLYFLSTHAHLPSNGYFIFILLCLADV